MMFFIFMVFLELGSWFYISIFRGNDLRDHYFGGAAFEFFAPTYIRLRPNGKGKKFEINKEGLVGDELSGLSNNTVRVVAIGGSTSFGNKNYLTKIARKFKESHEDENVSVSFSSAGTPGYSTFQSLINFQTRIVPLNPDVIIIYHGINDLEPIRITLHSGM